MQRRRCLRVSRLCCFWHRWFETLPGTQLAVSWNRFPEFERHAKPPQTFGVSNPLVMIMPRKNDEKKIL